MRSAKPTKLVECPGTMKRCRISHRGDAPNGHTRCVHSQNRNGRCHATNNATTTCAHAGSTFAAASVPGNRSLTARPWCSASNFAMSPCPVASRCTRSKCGNRRIRRSPNLSSASRSRNVFSNAPTSSSASTSANNTFGGSACFSRRANSAPNCMADGLPTKQINGSGRSSRGRSSKSAMTSRRLARPRKTGTDPPCAHRHHQGIAADLPTVAQSPSCAEPPTTAVRRQRPY